MNKLVAEIFDLGYLAKSKILDSPFKFILGIISIIAIIFLYLPYPGTILVFYFLFLLVLFLMNRLDKRPYGQMVHNSLFWADNRILRYPLLVLLVFYSLTHFPFIFSVYSEPDSISIANGIIDSIKNESYKHPLESPLLYNKSISFGYHLLIISFLKAIDIPLSVLPLLMNYLNAVIGLIFILPFYFVMKNLFTKEIAFYTTAIFIVTPSFWLSTVSGHPHFVGYFFLMLALFCLLKFLQGQPFSYVYYIFALLCWTIALTMKADIILISLLFFGLAYWQGKMNKKNILLILSFCLLSLVLFSFTKNIFIGQKESYSTVSILNELFNQYYGIKLEKSVPPLSLGAGLATFSLSLIFLLYYWVKNEYRLLLFLASWIFIPSLFWLLFVTNSARHNMMYVPPLIIMIVYYLYSNHRKYLFVSTAVIILSNYFMVPPSGGSDRPSGRLFSNYVKYQDDIKKSYLDFPRQIFEKGGSQVFIVYVNRHNPGFIHNVLLSADHYELKFVDRDLSDRHSFWSVQKITTPDKTYILYHVGGLTNLDIGNTNRVFQGIDSFLENQYRNYEFYIVGGHGREEIARVIHDHLQANGYKSSVIQSPL